MTFKTLACAAALALTAALPTQAATFNIAFDQASNGVGTDVIGSFEAPAEGGAVTNFTATINGVTYQHDFFAGLYSGYYAPVYNATLGVLTSQDGSAYFTASDRQTLANSLPTHGPALAFVKQYDQTGDFTYVWRFGTCDAPYKQCSTTQTGGAGDTYTITEFVAPPVSAVPLPAGLPLLAAGLGVLGLMRRRKA